MVAAFLGTRRLFGRQIDGGIDEASRGMSITATHTSARGRVPCRGDARLLHWAVRFTIRRIGIEDDDAMAAIIREVMTSFGASGPGTPIHDPEVDHMSRAYAEPRHAYFVVEEGGRVLGGAGIAPLRGTSDETCELRKMYFLPEARGRGAGRALIEHCLEAAKEFGFARCYLETLTGMDAAQALYRKVGFQPLSCARGATGHHGCDQYYQRDL